ncbi:MAG: cobalamin B12-binding domain-containing protein [bacterium]|nr:cobalamin B12-binding domain-containing protein [bacterium]
MAKRVVLVNPYFEGVVVVPTLGLGFIGTYLKERSNCEVKILEPMLQGLTEKHVLDEAKEAEIVGLTCYTESRFQVFNFAEKVKQVNPDCKIIIGGPHVNTLDELILKHYPFIDIIGGHKIRGKGETF